MKFDRRSVIAGAGALSALACVPVDQSREGRIAAMIRIIERDLGGRLGVAFFDPDAQAIVEYRGYERFPLASTFKASLAAFALAEERAGSIDLSQRASWTEEDLIFHTPFTGPRVTEGASLLELARAAQTVSDNLAANILLDRLGGPEALTAFWRSLGDEYSRLDRRETALNFVPPDELRDTTTPLAMARTLARILETTGAGPLGSERASLLRQWMIESTTGLDRIRAGLPDEWIAGDKTGNSGSWNGAMGYLRADIGFVESPARTPVFFAAYHQSPVGEPVPADRVDTGFAQLGRALTIWVRGLYTIRTT